MNKIKTFDEPCFKCEAITPHYETPADFGAYAICLKCKTKTTMTNPKSNPLEGGNNFIEEV